MKTLSLFCKNCKSITTVKIEDTRRISEVLAGIHENLICPKCNKSFDSKNGDVNMIPFNTKLIPTFLELHKKGYLVSLLPDDNGDYHSVYIFINTGLTVDNDLSQYHPLGLSIVNMGGTLATTFSLKLPVILEDDDIDELFAWALSLIDLHDNSLNTLNRMDTYEVNFSDIISTETEA